MSIPVKILIVEDEMLIAAKISLHLTKLGYDVADIVPTGEEAVAHCQLNLPDILLLDINLKGGMSGIDTATILQKEADIPIIYLTANTDQATFELAKETRPFAFIAKPYQKLDLQRAIELVVSRLNDSPAYGDTEKKPRDPTYLLSDRIFVRHKEKMIKLFLSDICYIEADRSYCRIFTIDAQHLLSVPLKKLERKLQAGPFFRIHRSYIINLEQLEEVSENHLVISQKTIPVGKSYKQAFLKRIQTI